MATLTAGDSTAVAVAEADYILLQNGPSDAGRLEVLTGTQAGQVLTANHSGRRKYGPVSAGNVKIASKSGALEYLLQSAGDITGPYDWADFSQDQINDLYLNGGAGDVSSDAIWTAEGQLVVSDGSGSAVVLEPGDDDDVLTMVSGVPAWAPPSVSVGQFGLVHGGIVTTPYRVTATGTPVGLSGPCLVESVKCIVVGTTTAPALHDDVDAATAAQLRWTRAIADLTVGDLIPVAGNGALMTFETGVYFTCPSGGEYIINAIVEE